MRKFLIPLAITAFICLSVTQAISQNVSGKIIRAATLNASNDILDPSAFPPSGFTSKSTLGFQGDDVNNAKLGFKAIPTFSTEPFGDLRRGPDHLYIPILYRMQLAMACVCILTAPTYYFVCAWIDCSGSKRL